MNRSRLIEALRAIWAMDISPDAEHAIEVLIDELADSVVILLRDIAIDGMLAIGELALRARRDDFSAEIEALYRAIGAEVKR